MIAAKTGALSGETRQTKIVSEELISVSISEALLTAEPLLTVPLLTD